MRHAPYIILFLWLLRNDNNLIFLALTLLFSSVEGLIQSCCIWWCVCGLLVWHFGCDTFSVQTSSYILSYSSSHLGLTDTLWGSLLFFPVRGNWVSERLRNGLKITKLVKSRVSSGLLWCQFSRRWVDLKSCSSPGFFLWLSELLTWTYPLAILAIHIWCPDSDQAVFTNLRYLGVMQSQMTWVCVTTPFLVS